VVGGPTRYLGNNAVEAELDEIETINEHVDGANRIVVVDPIIEAFRQKRRLPAIGFLNEPLHRSIAPANCAETHIRLVVFTQPGSGARMLTGSSRR
jgi:hypothetical protein